MEWKLVNIYAQALHMAGVVSMDKHERMAVKILDECCSAKRAGRVGYWPTKELKSNTFNDIEGRA